MLKRFLLHLLAGFAAILCCQTIADAAGPNTELPFQDDFDAYPLQTPLVDGINGWYASSSEAIVQDEIAFSGKAAQISIDVTLSNQFNALPVTKMWMEIMLRPVFYDGEESIPEVDPNATAMFYFSKDGRLVVHKGPPIGATNWLELTQRPNGSSAGTLFNADDWIQLHVFQDFTNKTYFMFANGLLMTNDVPFINNTAATFNGFDLYNGSGATSFIDNVWLMETNPPNLAANSSDFVPGIDLNITNFSLQIFAGQSPPDQIYQISKANGFFSLLFKNIVTTTWVNVSAETGISDDAPQPITLHFNTAGLNAGSEPYRSEIAVEGKDSRLGFPSSNNLSAVDVLLYIQKMDVSTHSLNNFVMQGLNAAGQTFDVVASGAGIFSYNITTNNSGAWVVVSPGDSILTNQSAHTITTTYNTASLALGQHTETLRVASATAGGATQDVNLVMNVQSLQAAPDTISGFAMLGAPAAAQSFAVKSGGAGSFNFEIATNGNATWIGVAPGSGVLTDVDTANITVSFAAASLLPGAYAETLKIFTENGGGATQNVDAILNVQELQVEPQNIAGHILAGHNPPTQNIAVSSLGKGSFSYSIATNNGAGWLIMDSGAGALTDAQTQNKTLSFNAAGLPPGAYTDTLKVFTTDGGGATQNVAVALNVQSFGVSQSSLTNQTAQGQDAPSQTFKVQSAGAGSIPYTITVVDDAPWLSPNPASGVLQNTQNDTITLSYSTAALSVGDHTATLRVATSENGGATQTVTVAMRVIGSGPSGPAIQVSPTALAQNAIQGKNPGAQSFEVSTTNNGPISYFIAVPQGGTWIAPTPSSGVLSGPATHAITLSYMTAGLEAGTHTGLVEVSTPDAGGATQRVAVTMSVAPMSGPLLLAPTLLTNAALVEETALPQDFSVFTTSSLPIEYTVTVPDAQTWLLPQPLSGVLTNAQQTDTIAVAYATMELPVGVYTSAIEVATPSGGGATQTVTVIMTIFDRFLPPPEGVTASRGTFTDKVKIEWRSVDNAQGYSIWRCTSDSTNDAVQIGAAESAPGVGAILSFGDQTCVPGAAYYFWVRAHNSAGPGQFGASAIGWRALESPSIMASQGSYHEKIIVEWSAVEGAATYELWRGLSSDIASATLLCSTSATRFEDTALAAPTHYYWVRAATDVCIGQFSAPAQGRRRPTGPSDFNGDGKADAWYYYQEHGMWYIVPTAGNAYNTQFGWWETEAAPGDYDGDGRLNLGVYHRAAGIWYLALNNGLYACLFGHPDADPVPADYDGDGFTDMGVYFRSSGAWYVLRPDGTLMAWNTIWGGPGLQPVRGDFDGDGKADLAVYDQRNGNWYVAGLDGTLLAWAFPFGFPGAEPVSGDFDGDQRTDFAVYYPPNGLWYIYTWQGEFRALAWGWAEAKPVVADFDGDGLDDIAVFHHDRYDARWYLLQSKDGYRMISSRENR